MMVYAKIYLAGIAALQAAEQIFGGNINGNNIIRLKFRKINIGIKIIIFFGDYIVVDNPCLFAELHKSAAKRKARAERIAVRMSMS